MTTLVALFAEVERDPISERTREGLAKARASGRKLGRPKGSLGVSRLDGKDDEIRHFLNRGRGQARPFWVLRLGRRARDLPPAYLCRLAYRTGLWWRSARRQVVLRGTEREV